ncbi:MULTISPECIES: hypothetical protein [unclassified Archaeoglobus]|nr:MULTISPECIES: hypothetical protein [unclassified Archaeoglobus]
MQIVIVIGAVNCKHHGLMTLEMCQKCPYFGGFVGFKQVRCNR